MRLPEKKEIDKLKILERESEVKEGLKLSRKVDEVRVELIKEENKLAQFRTETTKAVQQEIDALIARNNELKVENEILDRANKLLKEPFDKEWEELHQQRMIELNDNADRIEKARIEIEQQKAQISLMSAQIVKDKESIAFSLKEAYNEREVAKKQRLQADIVLENARISQAEAQSRIDAENNQLDKKAQGLALQLRDIQVREAAIQKSVRELARRERFINSKYKVLMNTEKALKQ